MQDKHRAIVAALRGRWTPDAADAFVQSLSDDAVELSGLIRDPDRTRVTWVGLAEQVAVAETLDALRALAEERVPVEAIVLNRLTPGGRRGCRFCAARRRLQQAATAALIEQLPAAVGRALPVTGLADRTAEPTGIAALTALSHEIAAGAALATSRRRTTATKTVVAETTAATIGAEALAELGTATLVLFGGKGGILVTNGLFGPGGAQAYGLCRRGGSS
jgi:anion-transporting  ArsA/GET3 family ATPase